MKTPKLVYISGPMTGIIDLNKKAFNEAEIVIESEGDIPVNPHKLTENICFPVNLSEQLQYNEYMKIDIRGLMDCQCIYMLSGWEKSKGAIFEKSIADFFGLEIIS